jgi:hypothetical protein
LERRGVPADYLYLPLSYKNAAGAASGGAYPHDLFLKKKLESVGLIICIHL